MTETEFETKLTSVNSKIGNITAGEAKKLKALVLATNYDLNSLRDNGIYIVLSKDLNKTHAPFTGQLAVLNVNTREAWRSGFQIVSNFTNVAIRTYGTAEDYRRFSEWKIIYSVETQ